MISEITQQYSIPLLGVSKKHHLHYQRRHTRHLIKKWLMD